MKKRDFHIRAAVPADVPTILELVKKLAEYERLSHEVTATAQDFLQFGFSTPAYYHALLAEAAKQPVGFSLFFYTFSTFRGKPTLYLEDLFVLPEWRGKGIGRAMLVELARIARQNHCGRMEWSVLDWNTPAIEFYKAIHAKPLSDWTTFRLTGADLKRLAEDKD